MTLLAGLSRLVSFLRSLLPWTLPLKLVLGALLGALGGAGVLGFLSEYATYSYAIHFGFRPPLEGIPYLKASVAILSFVLLLGGAVAFLASIALLRYLTWALSEPFDFVIRRLPWKSFAREMEESNLMLLRLPFRFKLALSVLSGIAVAALLFFAGRKEAVPSLELRWLTLGVGVYSFVVMLCTFDRSVIRRVGWLCTVGYFGAWLFLLFSPSWYALFLRTVGYGGGMPVTVEMREHSDTSAVHLSGYLMLRTTEALMIFMPSTPDVVEVPRDQIRTIRHPAGGLLKLQSRMPE